MDRAEQMREVIIHLIETKAPYGSQLLVDPIRALPLPPAPPLADDVASVIDGCRYDAGVLTTSSTFSGPLTAITSLCDAADMIERLARENAMVVAELEQANNEFGSQTAHWPDLWRRIADLKEESNNRWRRAEKAEGALASGMTDATNDFVSVCIERDAWKARAEKAEAEVARLRGALEFYANPSTYRGRIEVRGYHDFECTPSPLDQDNRGDRARAALTQKGADHG